MEHVDVLVVGAGLSGIAAGYYLQKQCPNRSYEIVERRSALGGTWDFFRYPGVRSDSEMFTLGYSFNPWSDPRAIVEGETILQYLRDTARKHDIERRVRLGWEVVQAEWHSDQRRWLVELCQLKTGAKRRVSTGFLLMCTGYYRYDAGYTPEFPGRERYRGQVLHPQRWPEACDYKDKQVLVIGSGATAVTLVPELAKQASHVTMLQRSPSWVVPLPATDRTNLRIHRGLPKALAARVSRWRNIALTNYFVWYCSRYPKRARQKLLGIAQRKLGVEAVREHFTPTYDPWQERLCIAPNGDLFKAVRAGQVSMVTDQIQSFTERGVLLKSGRELTADLIVTATGLSIELFSNLELRVDGERVKPSDCVSYRGAMLSGVPNLAVCLGYAKSSWTLKCELICAYACRVLNHMQTKGYRECRPKADRAQASGPFLDLRSGYIQRAVDRFPKQGVEKPWLVYQDYLSDWMSLRLKPLEDGVLEFS